MFLQIILLEKLFLYVVLYILLNQGDRKLITPKMISILNAGNVGFTTKYMYHRATYLTASPYSRYLIKFTEAAINPLLKKLNIDNIDELLKYPVYHFSIESQERIKQIFALMLEEYEKKDKYSEIVLENLLANLLIIVNREHIANSNTDIILNNVDNKILDALCYIESNFSNTPSINEVADYIGFSPSHFSRIFKKSIGITYSGYLLRIKLPPQFMSGVR